MTSATMERRQEAVLRSQTQKKNKGRSSPANMFSFYDYKTDRRNAIIAKMMERRVADEENKAIDALINRWLDEAWATGLNGTVINPDNDRHGYQALSEVEKWLENTGRGRLVGMPIEEHVSRYRLVLFPNKNTNHKAAVTA